jgi:drug/metabolite transporter (DMT)-like permease
VLIRPRPAAGLLMTVVAAFLFAVNGSVAKVILRSGITAPDLTTLRALAGCLGLVALGAALGPGIKRFRLRRNEIPKLVIYGLTGFFGVPILYFVGISRLPVGLALLFEYTAPLFVALWIRFGERKPVRARLWAGFVLSLLGLAGVAEIWGDARLDPLGVAASLAAAVLLAIYFVLGARVVSRRDPISVTGLAFGVSAIAGFVTRAVTGGLPDWRVVTKTTPGGVPIWLLCLYLVVLGTIVPYLLIVASLQHLPATSVGILGMLEPVLASAVAWIVLGEALTGAQLAGGAILLAGVVLAETARVTVRQNEPHAPAEDIHPPERDSSPAAAR